MSPIAVLDPFRFQQDGVRYGNCISSRGRNIEMKLAILFSCLACGLLFGSNKNDPQHLSGRERIALETSSPRVHIAGRRHKHMKAREDRVVSDKNTVNAFVPVGK